MMSGREVSSTDAARKMAFASFKEKIIEKNHQGNLSI